MMFNHVESTIDGACLNTCVIGQLALAKWQTADNSHQHQGLNILIFHEYRLILKDSFVNKVLFVFMV